MQRIFSVMLAVLLLVACGGTPYKRIAFGYNALDHTVRLTEGFDRAVAKWAKANHEKCLKAHGAKNVGYAKCVTPTLDFLVYWTGKRGGKPTGKGVLPAIQSAQKMTRLALDATFDYVRTHEKACTKDGGKADPECNKKLEAWKATLRPGLCVLVEGVDRGIKLGAYKATESTVYKTVVGIAATFCK